MKKFPSVIGITGSIIGAILLVVSFILGKIIWFVAGTFVILTALLVYVFFNIWDKRMGFAPKIPVTAVMSILYVALAAYAVFIVVGDNKAGSMDPMMNGGMDPMMNGMPEAGMEGGEIDNGLNGEGGEDGESLDGGENGEFLPEDGENATDSGESLENGESLNSETSEGSGEGDTAAEGESSEGGEAETEDESSGSDSSGNSGSSSGSGGSGSVNNSGISATMAVPLPAVTETNAVAIPIK